MTNLFNMDGAELAKKCAMTTVNELDKNCPTSLCSDWYMKVKTELLKM